MSPAFLQSWSWKDPCGDAGISLMELAEGAALWDMGKRTRVAFIFPVLPRVQDCGLHREEKEKDGDVGKKSKTTLGETCEILQRSEMQPKVYWKTKYKKSFNTV